MTAIDNETESRFRLLVFEPARRCRHRRVRVKEQ